MLSIKKILLPLDFPNASLRVVHEAAILARHFQAEIVMLHTVTKLSRAAGVPENAAKLGDWDMLAEILKAAQKSPEHATLGAELAGLNVHRLLAKGDPAHAIMHTAQQERVDLIMMPSRGHAFSEFLIGSVTAKVAGAADCPVWTGAHLQADLETPLENRPVQKLTIRHIVCAVDYRSHRHKTVAWAQQLAKAFDARLTLANAATASRPWGPGGNYLDRKWNDHLVADAKRHVAEIQKEMGIEAEVFVGCGDLPKVLSEAVKETKADVLVTGCRPCGAHLRTHGYGIIRELPIPVLCVGGS
jgi:nucleotide-binding universal stress UspA family protein